MSKFIHWLRGLWLASLQATINERFVKKLLTPMDFSRFRQYSDTLIETGTHLGESVQSALDAGFTDVRSVELKESIYLKAKERFEGNTFVTLFCGKSADCLPEMIKGIQVPSVFWLDAHPAGPGTAGHEEWLKRDESVFQDTVLSEELKIILSHGKHVILIDDQNGWETAKKFVRIIEDFYPAGYGFIIEDEIRPSVHYKEKVLICVPV